MRYRVTHITAYQYQEPVSQCFSEARLKPRTLPGQRVLDFDVRVSPEPGSLSWRQDYYQNDVASFSVLRTHDRFVTTAESVVEVDAPTERTLPVEPWEKVRDRLGAHPDGQSLAAYEFVFDSPYSARSAELAAYAAPTFAPGRPLAEAAQELSHRIHAEFAYSPKSTSIDMPLADVLKQRRGVCQDFAHLMVGALRSMGLAARYVSGYLRSGAEYQGAEASHAWVAVYLPGYGWLHLDPTNDVIPGEGHITVALGRDYGDVTPVKGVALGGGGHTLEVAVRVTPV